MEPHQNLLASPSVTHLPEEPGAALVESDGALVAAARYPASLTAWAMLAEEALAVGDQEHDVQAYAYARVGYHRGLDALRRNGWRGSGLVPWEHEPNRGFLRALWALSVAAERLGEADEAERCAQFLRDSSETAFRELAG